MTSLQKKAHKASGALLTKKAALQRLSSTRVERMHVYRASSSGTVPVNFAGSPADVIESMRTGVSAQAVLMIAGRLHITQDLLFESLRLPKSTIKARISGSKPLSSTEQDRIYRAERTFSRAAAVFEDEESARTWMTSEIATLGNVSPLSLLDTEAGYELVLDTLARIEYGVYA